MIDHCQSSSGGTACRQRFHDLGVFENCVLRNAGVKQQSEEMNMAVQVPQCLGRELVSTVIRDPGVEVGILDREFTIA